MAKKKPPTKEEKAHMSKVAALGCIACRNKGFYGTPAEIHHIRAGVGMGQRSGHKKSIPLCTPHHRTGGFGVAIHAGQKTWEAEYGTELELLEQVEELLRKQELETKFQAAQSASLNRAESRYGLLSQVASRKQEGLIK